MNGIENLNGNNEFNSIDFHLSANVPPAPLSRSILRRVSSIVLCIFSLAAAVAITLKHPVAHAVRVLVGGPTVLVGISFVAMSLAYLMWPHGQGGANRLNKDGEEGGSGEHNNRNRSPTLEEQRVLREYNQYGICPANFDTDTGKYI